MSPFHSDWSDIIGRMLSMTHKLELEDYLDVMIQDWQAILVRSVGLNLTPLEAELT